MSTLDPRDRTTMSVEDIYRDLKAKLGDYTPDFELRIKAELAYEINQLKVQRNAVILGHNYMEPALFHSVPDFVGDSLDLSRKAALTDRDVIVFCGVKFMAETAKILNPTRTVLIPSLKAGCSLAESITAADVRALKERFPGVPVVTYVNTYADVKAESDICCTSGNAVAVVESLGTDTVIFLPDEYLAGNVARETGKHIIFPTRLPSGKIAADTNLDYQMIGWRGRCEVHEKFTVDDIEQRARPVPRRRDPGAPGVQPRGRGRVRLLRQHQRHDPLRREDAGAALPAADRVLDGRQRRRGQPRQGDAAPVQRPLPAHEPDHPGDDARRAQVHAVRDRSAGGDPGAGVQCCGADVEDWVGR